MRILKKLKKKPPYSLVANDMRARVALSREYASKAKALHKRKAFAPRAARDVHAAAANLRSLFIN